MNRPLLHKKECQHYTADPVLCDSCRIEYEKELEHYIFSIEEELLDLKMAIHNYSHDLQTMVDNMRLDASYE